MEGMYGWATEYVDRIARAAKPSDLPIEQPTKFELLASRPLIPTFAKVHAKSGCWNRTTSLDRSWAIVSL
jgi:hypothetical protein